MSIVSLVFRRITRWKIQDFIILGKYIIFSSKCISNHRNRLDNNEEPYHQSWTKIGDLCLVSFKQKPILMWKLFNFEWTYLEILKEFWNVLGHFEYLREQGFRLPVFWDTSNKFGACLDHENHGWISKFHQDWLHYEKKTKMGRKNHLM